MWAVLSLWLFGLQAGPAYLSASCRALSCWFGHGGLLQRWKMVSVNPTGPQAPRSVLDSIPEVKLHLVVYPECLFPVTLCVCVCLYVVFCLGTFSTILSHPKMNKKDTPSTTEASCMVHSPLLFAFAMTHPGKRGHFIHEVPVSPSSQCSSSSQPATTAPEEKES